MKHIDRLKSLVLGAVLMCGVFGSAHADDTKIFFTTTNINVPANIMLILDTSGSMTIEVEDSTSGYDPAHDYGADGGTCSSSYAYFAQSRQRGFRSAGLQRFGFTRRPGRLQMPGGAGCDRRCCKRVLLRRVHPLGPDQQSPRRVQLALEQQPGCRQWQRRRVRGRRRRARQWCQRYESVAQQGH